MATFSLLLLQETESTVAFDGVVVYLSCSVLPTLTVGLLLVMLTPSMATGSCSTSDTVTPSGSVTLLPLAS